MSTTVTVTSSRVNPRAVPLLVLPSVMTWMVSRSPYCATLRRRHIGIFGQRRALLHRNRTVTCMDTGDGTPRGVSSEFVRSWIGAARAGDGLYDPRPRQRTAAWAQWAVSALGVTTGSGNREYLAFFLPARFYDPHGTAPAVRPHLEIPDRVLVRPDAEFPRRLAQAGNGLLFPWWMLSEVQAVKRAVVTGSFGPVGDLSDVLTDGRAALATSLYKSTRALAEHWPHIEDSLVATPDGLLDVAAGDFSPDDVAAYFPRAAEFSISVRFDRKLREVNQSWTARRVGVWHVSGQAPKGRFSFGVVTPRLTRSSLFTDEMFSPAAESPAALLVRGLIVRRLYENRTGELPDGPVSGPRRAARRVQGHLLAVPAKAGEKLPAASVGAAVKFLQEYRSADKAWHALSEWASTPAGGRPCRAILTVTEDGYKAAYRAAKRAVGRAEDPSRDDINVVLPLAWDASSKVVRVTFSGGTRT